MRSDADTSQPPWPSPPGRPLRAGAYARAVIAAFSWSLGSVVHSICHTLCRGGACASRTNPHEVPFSHFLQLEGGRQEKRRAARWCWQGSSKAGSAPEAVVAAAVAARAASAAAAVVAGLSAAV